METTKPSINDVRKRIVEIAMQQIGTKESPAASNKQKYGEWYGMNGQKWCAIFVSWVYWTAGSLINIAKVTGFMENKGFHHCESAYQYWKRTNKLTTDPRPGDIILYDWEKGKPEETPQEKLSDHVGIFVKWIDIKLGTFEAIEGNTASGNDSDGGEVEHRKRNVKFIKAFVNVLG